MKNRRVVLVEFYWSRDKDPRVPLGHASLLAALKQKTSCEVISIIVPVNTGQIYKNKIAEKIFAHTNNGSTEVDVAIGVYVWAEELVQDILPQLRRMGFQGRIILGGPQISYAGPGLETFYPHADVFIRGYGEQALSELVSHRKHYPIQGVHYKGTEDQCTNADVDLGELPSPWLTGAIPIVGQTFVRWETQRGCPFRCTFCQHKEAGARLKRRDLSMTRVLQEAEFFCSQGVMDIAVLDPIFNMNPRSVQILEHFANARYTGRISMQCRAESITEDFVRAAQNMNTRLEFGLQTIHRNESKAVLRANKMHKVDAGLALVREHNVNHEVSLIFGLPEQTLGSFLESVAWCLERHVPVIKAFPLMLLRGTDLERDRSQWGLLESGGSMPIVTSSDSFTHEEWRTMAQLSEALKQTEGHHPQKIQTLLQLAQTIQPDLERWSPYEPS